MSANNPLRLPGTDRASLVAQATMIPQPQDVGLLGDEKGTGYATDASPGDLELRARKGEQDQSYLSRDPQSLGQPGAVARQSLVAPGENGANGSRSAQEQSQAQNTNHPFGVQEAQAAAPRFKTPSNDNSGPSADAKPKPDAPPAQASVTQTTAQPVQVSAYRAPAGKPGPEASSALSPAPQAQSDSDPFAVVGSMEFRPGSTKVQCGRKHRITRPKLSWDTIYDFQGMMSAAVVLELQLDETGQVISAVVVKSSGSNSIDQPCRLAAYSWWFEPAKDANGKPIKDVIMFTVKFF